jgi:DNA polymerase III subunit delta
MVALKAADVERFVAHPDPAKPIALVFGPDAGLVHERSNALVRSAVADLRDPFALARIEGDALAEAPERLVEEALTVPLFGGRRAVWVKAGSKNFAVAVERLLAAPASAECRIVIEAGDLRRGAPLRTLCERAANAVALPCYSDDGRGLGRLIDEELRRAGLTITTDAKAMLLSLIGADRAASRSELRKLALYAHGKTRIALDDVTAIIGDASSPVLDAVIDAAFAGRPADLEVNFARVRSTGVAASVIAAAALRQAASLHRLRLLVDSGIAIRDAVDGATPKFHFSRTSLVQSALTQWSTARLERLIVQLGEASLDVRQRARLAYPITQRALLSIAVAARRGR